MSTPGGQHVSRLDGLIVIRLSLTCSSVAQLCLRCLSEIHLYRDRLWYCEIPYIGGAGQICQCIHLCYIYMHLCVHGIPLLSKGHQVYFYQFNSFMSYLANRTLSKHLIPNTCATSQTHVFDVSHSTLAILI